MAINSGKPDPNKNKSADSVKNKITDAYEKIKHNQKIEELKDYLQIHWRETVSYVVLILGLIILFTNPSFGGLLIGIVAGIFLYNEIIRFFYALWNDLQHAANPAKAIITAGTLLALFICAPAIFIGAAATIFIKHLINNQHN